jgi:hypothetical protein
VAAAWIGLAGGVFAALLSAWVAVRQSRIEAEVQERMLRLERDLRAEEVLTRYREPLAAAAFDLQSRLYNILRKDFLDKFGSGPYADEAMWTTLFRLAQYFGWTEILRRDIQFLSFPEDEATRRVAQLQSDIARCFLDHERGHALMIWSDEQRALGERMISADDGTVRCMGYSAFRDRCEEAFAEWRRRLEAGLGETAGRERLRDVQHLLCDLVESLDERRVRYTRDLERA